MHQFNQQFLHCYLASHLSSNRSTHWKGLLSPLGRIRWHLSLTFFSVPSHLQVCCMSVFGLHCTCQAGTVAEGLGHLVGAVWLIMYLKHSIDVSVSYMLIETAGDAVASKCVPGSTDPVIELVWWSAHWWLLIIYIIKDTLIISLIKLGEIESWHSVLESMNMLA